MTPEKRYNDLTARMSREPGVTHHGGRGFGSAGQLKVAGRIFAMLVRGELVVKLPAARVDQLVEHGDGRRFDAGKGKPMREWLVLSPTSRQPWTRLAGEALDFAKEDR